MSTPESANRAFFLDVFDRAVACAGVEIFQRDYPEAAPLSGERDPRIGTVMKVPGALGVRLTVASKVA